MPGQAILRLDTQANQYAAASRREVDPGNLLEVIAVTNCPSQQTICGVAEIDLVAVYINPLSFPPRDNRPLRNAMNCVKMSQIMPVASRLL
jgi:hypothetical protein